MNFHQHRLIIRYVLMVSAFVFGAVLTIDVILQSQYNFNQFLRSITLFLTNGSVYCILIYMAIYLGLTAMRCISLNKCFEYKSYIFTYIKFNYIYSFILFL